jgi:serine/threonine-protein phosphatase 6 regulatory ankyrin repeat subunit B
MSARCLQVVCKLLEFDADINISHVDGASPLYIACKNGHLQIVRKLLECKADINRTDNDGFSPLYVACRNGHVDIVCTLHYSLITYTRPYNDLSDKQ